MIWFEMSHVFDVQNLKVNPKRESFGTQLNIFSVKTFLYLEWPFVFCNNSNQVFVVSGLVSCVVFQKSLRAHVQYIPSKSFAYFCIRLQKYEQVYF